MYCIHVLQFIFFVQLFTFKGIASKSLENDDPSECIARLTLSTKSIFEGKLDYVSEQITNESFNASLTITRKLKGNSKDIFSGKKITVSLSTSNGLHLCSNEVDAVSSLVPQQTYVIFLNQSAKTSEPSATTVFYSEARIFPVSTTLVGTVRKYSCAKCGTVKVKLVPKISRLLSGQKLVMKCEISGKPMPVIKWLKDGQPLVTDTHLKVTSVKHVSYLNIAKVTISDTGSYQCRAVNLIAVINSSVSAIYVTAAADKEHIDVHTESCSTPDYCLNGGECLLLKSLGRKYCRCRVGFTGFRCYHQSSANFTTNPYVPIEANETFVISGIAITTLVVAGVAITVFCIVRKWWVGKHQRPRSIISVYRPPSLPDGHIFNVNQLHAAISQQSAIEYANLGRNSLVLSSFDSAADGSRRAPPRECEVPVLRRENRSNSSIVPPSNIDCSQRLSSFQAQLQRLSMHSSQQLQQPPAAARQRLPVISATPDCDPLEQSMFEMVNRTSVNDLDSSRCEQAAIETVERSQGRTQESVDLSRAVEEAILSPRSSQCSHTESLMCSGQAFCKDNSCGTDRPHPVSPPWYAAACKASAGSDISEDFDDERNAVDLEVNFESEADILGVETSGDELERVGTGRDFSEMSSQLTERGISDEEDGNCSSASDADGGGVLEEDAMFGGANQLLLGYMRSGSDLSWDESADLPSFAVNGNLLHFNRT